MMSNLKILIISCVALGSAHSFAMEENPSQMPTLYQMTLKKLSEQDDVNILIQDLKALPDELAWDLFEEVLISNFLIGSHGNAQLLEAFQKRPNLSKEQKDGLEVLGQKALSGNLRSEDLAMVLQEIRVEFKKKSIAPLLPSFGQVGPGETVRAMEPEPKRAHVLDNDKIVNLSQRVDYGLAKMYLEKWKSLEMVNELLFDILLLNFSLNWVQKCNLIQIVRDRHAMLDPENKEFASKMEIFFDGIEGLMLRGRPLHGLSHEVLMALYAPAAKELNALESQ